MAASLFLPRSPGGADCQAWDLREEAMLPGPLSMSDSLDFGVQYNSEERKMKDVRDEDVKKMFLGSDSYVVLPKRIVKS